MARLDGHLPGEVGIWVFITGDLLVFSLFFCVFLLARGQQPALFEQSRLALHTVFGAVNTMLLLTSSVMVVQAVHSARGGFLRTARRLLVVAMLCGGAFVVDKGIEYTMEIQAGHTITSNLFFTYYFMFTAIHLLHLLVGMLGLTLMYRIARRPVLSDRDRRNLEVGASYWHLIDLLWIVLFALLYLSR